MNMPIIDLHCDLLAYLAENPLFTPVDPESRCSLPQLNEGGVRLQTLALFTETEKGSTKKFNTQLACFDQKLSALSRLTEESDLLVSKLHLALAIENMSGLLEEDEPLKIGLDRLRKFQSTYGPILYASLTWNSENRFGGGNQTQKGLTREGEILLEALGEWGIAIDLSHASDPLADDILNFIYKKEIKTTPIASHSNFREVQNVARNLPTDVALEIARLGGVIGLCLFAPFLGPSIESLYKHIEFGETLGIAKALAFGSDFFGSLNLPSISHYPKPLFFPEAADASCFSRLSEKLPAYAKGVPFHNAHEFINRTMQRYTDIYQSG
jgi:membrane dipeptidase